MSTLSSLSFTWDDPEPDSDVEVRFRQTMYGGGRSSHIALTTLKPGVQYNYPFLAKPFPVSEADMHLALAHSRPLTPEDVPDVILLAGERYTGSMLVCPIQSPSQALLLVWLPGTPLDSLGEEAYVKLMTASSSAEQQWSFHADMPATWVREDEDPNMIFHPSTDRPLHWWLQRLKIAEPSQWRIVI